MCLYAHAPFPRPTGGIPGLTLLATDSAGPDLDRRDGSSQCLDALLAHFVVVVNVAGLGALTATVFVAFACTVAVFGACGLSAPAPTIGRILADAHPVQKRLYARGVC